MRLNERFGSIVPRHVPRALPPQLAAWNLLLIRTMRILFCNYEYPPLGGGGGVVMAALARQLARRHEVTVITSRAGDLRAEDDDGGVRVLRVPVFFRRELAVANFPSMAAYLPTGFMRGLRLGKNDFDVINTHFVVPTGPLGHALGALAWRAECFVRAWRRSVRSQQGQLSASACAAASGRSLAAARRRRCRRPIARHSSPRHRAVWRAAPGRIDSAGHRSPAAGERALAPSIGIAARRVRVDHHRPPGGAQGDDAVDRHVRRQPHSQRSSGDRRRRPRRAGRSSGARSSWAFAIACTCWGKCPMREKYAALSMADAFVTASQHEGFGLVFLEAMAFGLPVLCYDRGGQTDFLTTRRNRPRREAQRSRRLHPRAASSCTPTATRANVTAGTTGNWSRTISSIPAPRVTKQVFSCRDRSARRHAGRRIPSPSASR